MALAPVQQTAITPFDILNTYTAEITPQSRHLESVAYDPSQKGTLDRSKIYSVHSPRFEHLHGTQIVESDR